MLIFISFYYFAFVFPVTPLSSFPPSCLSPLSPILSYSISSQIILPPSPLLIFPPPQSSLSPYVLPLLLLFLSSAPYSPSSPHSFLLPLTKLVHVLLGKNFGLSEMQGGVPHLR